MVGCLWLCLIRRSLLARAQAWSQYDPHIVVPKEWGKQVENWKAQLRDWPEPNWDNTGGAQPTWKGINYKRWPMHRIPKYDRTGYVVR